MFLRLLDHFVHINPFVPKTKGALGINGLSTIELNTTQHLENKNISQIKQKIYYFKGSSFDIVQILKGILNEK